MAFAEELAWYLEGSGVPIGWKEGAVGFKDLEPFVVGVVGLEPSTLGVVIAIGAMMKEITQSNAIIGIIV